MGLDFLMAPFTAGMALSKARNDEVKLERPQGFIILGPVIFSPIAAVASLIQITVGAVFALTGKISSKSQFSQKGIHHLKSGGIDLAYALLNICTLGGSGAVNSFSKHLSKTPIVRC